MSINDIEKQQLITDIRDIKLRLCGNPDLKEKGFIQETQEEIAELKQFKLDTINHKFKLSGIAIGAAAVFSMIIWVIEKVLL